MTWITRILINECKMMLRRRKQGFSLDLSEVMEKHSISDNAMETLNKQQINQWLEQAVLNLPEKYRLVYVIREVNEISTDKTAAMLGISEENVKVRLHRAKSMIKEQLLGKATAQELFAFGNNRCLRLTEKVMQALEGLPTPVVL